MNKSKYCRGERAAFILHGNIFVGIIGHRDAFGSIECNNRLLLLSEGFAMATCAVQEKDINTIHIEGGTAEL